jgi:hypothetical protein
VEALVESEGEDEDEDQGEECAGERWRGAEGGNVRKSGQARPIDRLKSGASQKSAQSDTARRWPVVAADFKVPIFEHFRPPPFSTVQRHEFAGAIAFAPYPSIPVHSTTVAIMNRVAASRPRDVDPWTTDVRRETKRTADSLRA